MGQLRGRAPGKEVAEYLRAILREEVIR